MFKQNALSCNSKEEANQVKREEREASFVTFRRFIFSLEATMIVRVRKNRIYIVFSHPHTNVCTDTPHTHPQRQNTMSAYSERDRSPERLSEIHKCA